MKKKHTPSKEKAAEMLHNPPHGKPLTDKQRKYFAMLANALNGISITNEGRDYSPAWGGQFQEGGVVTDNNGYYNPANEGKPVRINSNQITMKGIPYPVAAISDAGDTKIMQPNKDYTFKGKSVLELPTASQNVFQNWDGIVEKADGSIGHWGNDFKEPTSSQYRLYPRGIITQEDVKYLSSLNDEKINKALKRINNNSYGENDSDMFKQILKKKSKMQKGGSIPKELEQLISFAQDGKEINKYTPYINAGEDVIQGLSMLKQQKQNVNSANQMAQLTDIQAQASASMNQDPIRRRYVRPEDVQSNQLFPSYGTGTNILSMQQGGNVKNKPLPKPKNDIAEMFDFRKPPKGDLTEDELTYLGHKWRGRYGADYLPNDYYNGIEKHQQLTPSQVKQVSKYMNSTDVFTNIWQSLPNIISDHRGKNNRLLDNGGEISNVYNTPDTIYTDLEYTPLNNPSQVKSYQYGGNIKDILNSGKFGEAMNNYGIEALEAINPYVGHVPGQMPTAGNKIGKGIGTAAGTFFGGPIGGAIGGFAGNILGGIFDRSDNKIRKYENQTQENINNILGSYVGMGIHNSNKAFMKEGGNIAMDGELQTYEDGGIETLSENPWLPDGGETIEFKGSSHEDGGIPITYGNSPVEVEGGEPAMKLDDSLVVFGNLKIPNQFLSEIGDKNAKGKKFKNYIKDLSKIEEKQNKIVNKSIDVTNDLNPVTSFDKLKMTTMSANIMGANMKLKDIAEKKYNTALVQDAINKTAEEYNLDADHLAQGKYKKAKNGITMAQMGIDIYNPRPMHVPPVPYTGNIMLDPVTITGKKILPKPIKTPHPIKPIKSTREAPLDSILTYPKVKAGMDAFNIYGEPSSDAIVEQQPLTKTEFTDTPKSTENNNIPWMDIFNQALPYLRPSNKQDLDPNQLMGELYALSNNELEPVQAQTYQPQLSSPHDVSLQDQLNANQSDFNAIQRQLPNNPEALSILAAQKYGANQKVLGEQFRLNQGEKQRVYEGNRNILNDAQLKNLGILDQQYTRQAQAKSNTKAITQQALNSISSKIAQNKLENKTLQTYENLYNYRYDSNGRAVNMNPLAQFDTTIQSASLDELDRMKKAIETRTSTIKRDKDGHPIGSTETTSTKSTKRNGAIVQAIKNL